MRLSFACLLWLSCGGDVSAADWPAWRGPTLRNVVEDHRSTPIRWSQDQNVVWRARIPGHGHSTPVVIGDLVLVTTADTQAETQSIIALRRADGQAAWSRVVHTGELPGEIHKKNTHATPTPVVVGDRLFVVFCNRDRVQVTALSLAGEIQWQTNAGDYLPDRYKFGYAPSPAVAGELIFVAAEYESGYLVALRQDDGQEVWRVPRTDNTSYSSPLAATIAGRTQLVLSGRQQVTSYEPETGAEIWSISGVASATCGTIAWEGDLIGVSGGYPESETLVVRGDGSAEVLWRNKVGSYEPSLVAGRGCLFAFTDEGIAHCWDLRAGHERWKRRLGGPVSCSPLLVGDKLYLTNNRGRTFVVAATPDEFKLLAENELGDGAFASLIASGDQLLMRVRDEAIDPEADFLYCLGETEPATIGPVSTATDR